MWILRIIVFLREINRKKDSVIGGEFLEWVLNNGKFFEKKVC